ncbi:hypothetical protein [Bacillus cereus group sp. BfR-BA-01317]|uniref:hypothetical protein n=1 Tax=Bacillus cereus group sp. BfR-BA-01317 TaxID=2920294 RepID=UPI001F593B56|nr:hypothetical protein [Bacillus cereus group sp. BfR-BA-01317]
MKSVNKEDNELFYVLCFAGIAFLIIFLFFGAPAIQSQEEQSNRNIEKAEKLIEEFLQVNKTSFEIEVNQKELNTDNFANWTSEKLECVVYTNGKRYKIQFGVKKIKDKGLFEPIKIKKIVER